MQNSAAAQLLAAKPVENEWVGGRAQSWIKSLDEYKQ